ncbi:MAG: hypothetical protein DMG18_12465 [Acidobacteria bacterium]|nr:MAG: hypothetical protein DMG18_12465 [Acidobacteriota bacterium]
MIILLLLSIPSVASAAIMGTRRRRTMEWIHASATVVALIVGASIGTRIWAGEPVVSWSLLRADALSAFMIGIVTFVGAVAGLYSVAYMRLEFDDNHLSQVRLFYALFQLFIFTMLLAVATDNLGLMWVAVEGTTLATVFLVNLHDSHTGLEAAYEYLIISDRSGRDWPELDNADQHRRPVESEHRQARVHIHLDRIWHQGGFGADAHVAAGRAQRSARPDQRAHVGRSFERWYICVDPVQDSDRRCRRSGIFLGLVNALWTTLAWTRRRIPSLSA